MTYINYTKPSRWTFIYLTRSYLLIIAERVVNPLYIQPRHGNCSFVVISWYMYKTDLYTLHNEPAPRFTETVCGDNAMSCVVSSDSPLVISHLFHNLTISFSSNILICGNTMTMKVLYACMIVHVFLQSSGQIQIQQTL